MRKIGALFEFKARLQSVLHFGRGKLKSTVDTNVIDGMWLNDSLESTSDILIAGRSTLKIQYLYEAIETDRSMEHLGEASVPCRD